MIKKLSYKGISIMEKPWFMKILALGKARGVALFSKIYLRKDLFDKFASDGPDIEISSVLEHEIKHVERGKEKGPLKTAILYWLIPRFRANEEFEAIKMEMKFLKKSGQCFDFNKRARNLSGFPYLWAISYSEARKQLTKIWNSL